MRRSKVGRVILFICRTSLLLSTGTGVALATESIGQSTGQTIYAAAYSHVIVGTSGRKFPIASTLVIRNADLASAITVTSVDYRDSQGGHLRHLVEKRSVLGPLASKEFSPLHSDETGGHSPSFLVRWEADKKVNAPVVEVLLIGKSGGHGLSFVGRAWVIEEDGDPELRTGSQILAD